MKNQKRLLFKKKSLKVIDLILFNINKHEKEILAVGYQIQKQKN